MADAGYANTAACNIKDCGAKRCASWDLVYEQDGEGDFRMVPSFSTVVKKLQQGLHIRFSSPVCRIERSKDGICAHSRGGVRIHADCAIVTPSIGVLQAGAIEFSPALPKAKQEAIQRIQLADAVKIHLTFNKRFWPEDCHGVVCTGTFVPEFWINTNSGIGAYRDSDDSPVVGAASASVETVYVITGFATSKFARRIVGAGHDVAIATFLSQLDAVFCGGSGKACLAFLKGQVHSWRENEWVLGGYTCPNVHEPDWARRELARPVGMQLYFAGEACAGTLPAPGSAVNQQPQRPVPPMTVHGAIESGWQVAAQVARDLGIHPVGAELQDNRFPQLRSRL